MDIALLQLTGQLALAVLAGALLNLTPCVLPAIPIKIRTIVHEAGSRRRQRALAAAAFAGGTLSFFLLLAVASAALHWTWGALFQSPALLAVLVAVLVLFAYGTYRDINIGVPRFAYNLRGRRYFEPFLSGLFSALLATPCTGPFLGGVLAFTITQPAMAIVAIFMAVGLGLALPYIVLLMRPSLLDKLPRPGAWTVRVRQGLAFVLLAAAVFFAQSLVADMVGRGLWLGWLVLLFAWAGMVALRSSGFTARAIGPAFAIAGAALVYSGSLLQTGPVGALAWRPMTASNWQEAQAGNRPVLVEYTADWCINCKVLERTVYNKPEVSQVVNATNMVTLQADLTHPKPRLQQHLLDHGGAGLPYAVVLDASGRVVAQFSGLFSTTALVEAIRHTSG